MSQRAVSYQAPVIADDTEAKAREEREERDAREKDAKLRRAREVAEIEERRKAVREAAAARQIGRAEKPIRQITFILTKEEHLNLSTHARKEGLSMKDLIAFALKPWTEK